MTVVVPSLGAQATSEECTQTWERLIVWSVAVHEQGVDSAVLDALSELTPALEGCHRGHAAGLHDGMGGNSAMWRPLVDVYFDSDDVDRVMCLMGYESGGNPNARNRKSGAAGLMQVMPWWAEVHGYEVDDLYDPGINLWIASQILDQQGWSAWSPYLRGSCR
jgi:hypothetical protein